MGKAFIKEQAYVTAHIVCGIGVLAVGVALKGGGNLLAVYGMDKIAEIARVTGDTEVAEVCKSCADRIGAALEFLLYPRL